MTHRSAFTRPLFRLLAAGVYVLAAASAAAPAADHWLDLLNAARYTELTEALREAQERLHRGEFDDRDYSRALHPLTGAPAETSPRFDEWVEVSGDDGHALMARGLFWAWQGWRARGQAYARDTSEEQFARMHEYFGRAVPDLREAIARLGRCSLCYSTLIGIAMAQGTRAEKAELYNEAMANDPLSIMVPIAYLGALEPKWGGRPGEAAAFVAGFRKDYPSSPAVTVLESELIIDEGDKYYYAQKYVQAIPFYERALAMDPKRGASWYRYAYALASLNRRAAALEAVNRSLAIQPRDASAVAYRAWLLLESSNPEQGLADLTHAVALGNRWALRKALSVWGRGEYGQPRDHAKTWTLCRDAVKVDNPDGYACTGGHYYFGHHVKPDRKEAAKWFRIAADRGVEIAMVDLAIMLWRGDGVERDEAQAIAYWRQARALNEPRAEQKLREHLSAWRYFREVQLRDWWERLSRKVNVLFDLLLTLLRLLLKLPA